MSTVASIFDSEPERYDAWFDTPDGQVLFDNAFPFGRGEWAGQFVHVVLRAPCPVKGVTAQ